MAFDSNVESFPRTEAVRRALATALGSGAVADLIFMERWVAQPSHDLAATLRAGQIRRANPTLAEAIQRELRSSIRLFSGA